MSAVWHGINEKFVHEPQSEVNAHDGNNTIVTCMHGCRSEIEATNLIELNVKCLLIMFQVTRPFFITRAGHSLNTETQGYKYLGFGPDVNFIL
jgi:hypothetical protein